MKGKCKMGKTCQAKKQKEEKKKAQNCFKNKSKTIPGGIRGKQKGSNYLVLHGK